MLSGRGPHITLLHAVLYDAFVSLLLWVPAPLCSIACTPNAGSCCRTQWPGTVSSGSCRQQRHTSCNLARLQIHVSVSAPLAEGRHELLSLKALTSTPDRVPSQQTFFRKQKKWHWLCTWRAER